MKRVRWRLTLGVTVALACAAGASLGLASDSPTVTLVSGSPFLTGDVGYSSYSVAFNPSGTLLATSNLSAGSGSALAIFTVASNGALSAVGGGVFLGGQGTVSAEQTAFSPNGDFLAVSELNDSTDAGTIAIFGVNSAGQASTVPNSPFATGYAPYGLAFSPNGKYLATTNYLDDTVSVFSVASDGELAAVTGSPFSLGGTGSAYRPYGLAFSPDGNTLAVTLPNDDAVAMLSFSSSGALAPVAQSPFTTGSGSTPQPVAFSPLGNLIVTGDTGDNSVSLLAVTSGATATLDSGFPYVIGPYPDDVAISPDGGVLVVPGPTTSSNTSSLDAFAIGSGGTLTALSGSPFNTYGVFGPDPVAFSPNGAFLAAALATGAQSGASNFTVSPALAPLPPSTSTTTTTTPVTTTPVSTPPTTAPPKTVGPVTPVTSAPKPPPRWYAGSSGCDVARRAGEGQAAGRRGLREVGIGIRCTCLHPLKRRVQGCRQAPSDLVRVATGWPHHQS
jgi:6-phosphogluconolactonase